MGGHGMIEITSQNIETAKAMRVSSPDAKVKVRAGQLGVCTELSALGFTHFSADLSGGISARFGQTGPGAALIGTGPRQA
jgi:hypothetical protein